MAKTMARHRLMQRDSGPYSRLFVLGIFLLTITCLSSPAYSASPSSEADTQDEAPRLNVSLVTPRLTESTSRIVGTGSVFAAKTSNVGTLVSGQVHHVFVKVGDQLEEGAPLFKIRPENYEFVVEEIKAKVAVAKANAEKARLDFNRAKALINKRAVSEAKLDEARNAYAATRAEVGVAEARLKLAEQNLSDTVVRAPFRCVVTERNIDEGVYLSVQSAGMAGSSVVQVKKIDVVTVIVGVPAQELERLRIGAPAFLTISGLSAPIEANVSVINDRVDPTSRMIEVRFVVRNSDYRIKPGLFVYAEVEPERRKVLVLSRHSVLGATGATYVYVLDGDVARRRPVRISDFDASDVEIISGLSEKDTVLTGPDLYQVQENQKITGVPDVAG